jgi:ketosteroid isomerase-like protein
MVAVFATGDVDAIDSLVHPDYVDHQGLGGQPMHGPSGFARVVVVARSGFSTLDTAVHDVVEAGQRASATVSWHGRRATGEVVERRTREVILVRDGLAVEHWGERV